MIIYGYKALCDDDGLPAECSCVSETLPSREPAGLTTTNLFQICRSSVDQLSARQTAADAARQAASANASDKDAARLAKRAEQDLADLKAEIALAEKKIEAVESNAGLKSLADAHPSIGELATRDSEAAYG